MYEVELYRIVRHAVFREGLSQRDAATRFGLDRGTVKKMLEHPEPPGYRRSAPRTRSRMDAHAGFVDAILTADLDAPKKQRHTIQRIYERLVEERGFQGGYTTVRDYVRPRRLAMKEVFVPLAHPPGHAQADFGEARAIIGGVERKIHFLVVDLPQSDAIFVKAYPAETAEAFCDGHVLVSDPSSTEIAVRFPGAPEAFDFFGGVPLSILYDNTRFAVAKILGDGTRQCSTMFCALQSHYLFEDRFGRPGKGNDKGKVKGLSKRQEIAVRFQWRKGRRPGRLRSSDVHGPVPARCRFRRIERDAGGAMSGAPGEDVATKLQDDRRSFVRGPVSVGAAACDAVRRLRSARRPRDQSGARALQE